MKILLIPLDERPCNRIFPKMICNSNESIELKEPNMSLLGRKKQQLIQMRYPIFYTIIFMIVIALFYQ